MRTATPASPSSGKNSRDGGKKTAQKGAKGKGKVEPEVPTLPIAPATPVVNNSKKQFSPEQIKAIAKYVTDGIFAHFTLFRAMFNREFFSADIKTEKVNTNVMTVINDGLSLRDAISVEEIERLRQEKEEADAVAAKVIST